VADGGGGSWMLKFAQADDIRESDGERVLTYWEAQRRAFDVAEQGADLTKEDLIKRKALSFLEQGTKPACYLYRHYHPDGDLLYVGISVEPLSRLKKHMESSGDWTATIYRILIEPFETRAEALAAEKLAIRTEFPRFNARHNGRHDPVAELTRGGLLCS
jgi:predicted GIY-YIG superfamily endonuclease